MVRTPQLCCQGMDSIKPHSATKKKERQEENNSITGKHGKGITRPEILKNTLKLANGGLSRSYKTIAQLS